MLQRNIVLRRNMMRCKKLSNLVSEALRTATSRLCSDRPRKKAVTMLKTSIFLGVMTASAFALAVGCSSREASETSAASGADLVASEGLVISQVFTGGGVKGAPYANDFVEIFNRGTWPVTLEGKWLQYADNDAEFRAPSAVKLPVKTLAPGQYFLVQLGVSTAQNGALPEPDVKEGTAFTLGDTSGKLAIVRRPINNCGTTAAPCSPSATIDLVAYGATAPDGGTAIGALTHTTAAKRKNAGCTQTGDNGADFETSDTPAPRNSKTTPTPCVQNVPTPADAGPPPVVLLNEVNVSTQGIAGSPWAYAEIQCTPNASLAGYYFVVTDAIGTASIVVDLGAPRAVWLRESKCGANGFVYIKSAEGGRLPEDSRSVMLSVLTADAGTTQAVTSTGAFMIVKSPVIVPTGSDFDVDDNGNVELPTGASIVDGISLAAATAV
jgi:hypothetical protein